MLSTPGIKGRVGRRLKKLQDLASPSSRHRRRHWRALAVIQNRQRSHVLHATQPGNTARFFRGAPGSTAIAGRRWALRAFAPGQLDVLNLRGRCSTYDTLLPRIAARAKQGNYALIVLDPIYKFMLGSNRTKIRRATWPGC